MRILALLPNTSFRVLEHALVGGYSVARETLDDNEFEELLPPLAHRHVPVLLFTSLTPAAARRIVSAAELGAHELVLRGEEHTGQLLAHKLASLYQPSAPAHLLSRAAPRLRRFPDSLQTAAVALFASGPLPRWVDELAQSSGFARRSVDRWMLRVGIQGASMLLDTARLARAWEPLVEEKRSTAVVSERCGYARPRLFVSHARRIIGIAPSEMAISLSRRDFSERLARALLRN
jgi:AraC-like DNA-binding protein